MTHNLRILVTAVGKEAHNAGRFYVREKLKQCSMMHPYNLSSLEGEEGGWAFEASLGYWCITFSKVSKHLVVPDKH